MKSNNSIKTTVGLLFVFTFGLLTSQGQSHYTATGKSRISISGTSTMHDWTMKSENAVYNAVFKSNPQGNPEELISLTLSVPAESLKSGKGGMDKNAYAALKTDAHKQITFQLTSAKIEGKIIRCQGSLTIAGTTRQIDIDAAYTISPSGSIQVQGSKNLAMTDYDVEPPSFMFGSVTTGNEITVSFDVTLAPRTQPITLN